MHVQYVYVYITDFDFEIGIFGLCHFLFCLLKYKTFSIYELFIRLNRANLSKKLR